MSNRMRGLVAIGAAAAVIGLLAPSAAEAQELEIVSFTYGGSGCPAGSMDWIYDEVNNQTTMKPFRYTTTLPPGESAACTSTFVVKVPSGKKVRFRLKKVEYTLHVDTEDGVQGVLHRTYKYGTDEPRSFADELEPGYQGDYRIVDELPGWSEPTNQVTVMIAARIDLQAPRGFEPTRRSKMTVELPAFPADLVDLFEVAACPPR